MRLKKGSKVEVLSTDEVAIGSWRSAEIITGNGRAYTLKYSGLSPTTTTLLEKVPRKAIRPCPPPVEGLDNWVPGDLVEVFHNLSWRTSIVVEVMDGNYFLVRLLGLTMELKVQKSHLRVRQSWENGTWFVVGQGSRSGAMPTGKRLTCIRTREHDTVDFCPKEGTEFGIPLTFSIRKKKRLPFGSSCVGSCNGAAQKVRIIEKDGSCYRTFLENAPVLSEKVDAHVRSSFNNRRNECYRRETGRGDSSILSESPEQVDTDSCMSSVGSCSANSFNVHDLPFSITEHRNEDTDSLCSDAESFCGRRCEEEECLPPINEKSMLEVGSSSDAESFSGRGYANEDYPLTTNDKSVGGVHRSTRPGLRAYRCFMEALFASGPLTWEEELKMSNLRHSLCISDDEHLIELRNLIAT